MLPGYYHIGRIFRKFSYKGELLIKIKKEIPDIITTLEPVFIEMYDTPVPFFIERFQYRKADILRVKFEDIDDEAAADSLLKKNVYIPIDRLPELDENEFYQDEITGFRVIDPRVGDLGKVVYVNDDSPQTFMEVENESGVLLIPVEAFIRKIDRQQRIIEVEIPEGMEQLRQ